MAASGRGWNTSLAITALCSVQFVDVLGVTVVVTALPRMLADLKAPASAQAPRSSPGAPPRQSPPPEH